MSVEHENGVRAYSVFVHEKVHQVDFFNILKKQGKPQQDLIRAHFKKRIEYLQQHGAKATQHHEWFKSLAHSSMGFIEIRLNSVKLLQVRALYLEVDGVYYVLKAFSKLDSTYGGGKGMARAQQEAMSRFYALQEEAKQ